LFEDNAVLVPEWLSDNPYRARKMRTAALFQGRIRKTMDEWLSGKMEPGNKAVSWNSNLNEHLLQQIIEGKTIAALSKNGELICQRTCISSND
jgi:hypothetical protein